jgi:hypothetical protein
MNEYLRILTSTSLTVNRMASILKQHGIPTLIKDNVESGRLAGFGALANDVDLFVEKGHANKARELVEESGEGATRAIE